MRLPPSLGGGEAFRTKSRIADVVGLVAFVTMLVSIDAPMSSRRFWAFFALGLIMRVAGFIEGIWRVLDQDGQ